MVAQRPIADRERAAAAPDAERSEARRSAVMMDVARLAGVSHQTVSRVLNDHPSVRAQTRDRVLDAMRQLDYRPNSAARTLVTRKSQTLGLVGYETTLVGPASMLYSIEGAARRAGYFVSIASVQSLDTRSVLDAINRLRDQAVEGIIAIVPQESAVEALARVPHDIALVGVGLGEASDVPMVGLDNTGGAKLAVNHLLDLGHERVHHICGPRDWPEANERLAGWREVAGAGTRRAPVALSGDWSARSGYEAGRKLAADRKVTAVFCANDHMALGALRALAEAGRPVPGDVSVVGFDDIPEAPYLIPPLTTVQQDFGGLGRRSLELLMEQVGTGGRTHRNVRLAPHLVVRNSTAPPRSRS
ncbi:MAG TPA: LacI family DNA-binding transcriptional regulator [Micromonosporaceae bacterium]|jgi:DNA-binding LacI/PurR family transcriptional regulator|nr:LacI family DNA-binding transcriptional regulator [Micromonosporaceae bacterium]